MNSKNNNDYLKPSDLNLNDEDKLHKADGEKNDIITAYSDKKSFLKIASGFFSAANNLAKNKDAVVANSWIYPIVYMYGHYMELILKEIIRIGTWYEEFKDKKKKQKLNEYPLKNYRKHDLRELWCDAKDYMYKIDYDSFDNVKDELIRIENCVNQLDELYGGGTKFRYMDNEDSDIDINIDSFRITMKKIDSTVIGYILGIHNKIKT